jgi:uncharacterized protein (DUF488 family)
MRIWTIGHGTRPAKELIATLLGAGVGTLVDVRRFPGSRRNPQFGQAPLAAALAEAGIVYVHEEVLGGRRSRIEGEVRFGCIRVAGLRSYAAWMGTDVWQAALARTLAKPAPCYLCAERLPWRCHRHLIGELLAARGIDVVHLLGPGEALAHLPFEGAEAKDGRLYLCGKLVA